MRKETWGKIEKEFDELCEGEDLTEPDFIDILKSFLRQKLDQREKEILEELLKEIDEFELYPLEMEKGLPILLKVRNLIEQKLKQLKK